MILLVHMFFGAAIGSLIGNIPLAVFLSFLSHYFLDILPHIEYSIENIAKKQWAKTKLEILSVILDFSVGILLISIFSQNTFIFYIFALIAILPDGFTVFNIGIKLHGKIHFLKQKKIPNFWRFSTQIIIIIISIFLFRI